MGGAINSLGGSVTVVQSGDVTLERRIHPSGRNESFVTMAVRNTGDSDLSIQVQERVSEAVENATPIESFDRDSSSWEFDGDRIVHEHEVAAGNDRAVIYEIALSDGSPEMELSQPSIVDVEPVAAASTVGSGDDDATGDTLWRGETSTEGPTVAPSDGAPGAGPSRPGGADESTLLERLVTELESADSGELEALRERLRPGQSERVRLDHFRSRVDDLEAYVEILETFLDEYGRPDDVVDDIRDRFDENERELQAHRSEIEHLEEAAAERQRAFETTTEQFEDELERLEREFEALREQVEEWRSTQDQIAAALAGGRTEDEREA